MISLKVTKIIVDNMKPNVVKKSPNKIIKEIKRLNYKNFSPGRQKFYCILDILGKLIMHFIFFVFLISPYVFSPIFKTFNENIFGDPAALFSVSLTVYVSTFLTVIITLVNISDKYTNENEYKIFKKIYIFGYVDVGIVITESVLALIIAFSTIFTDIDSSKSYSVALLIYSVIFLIIFFTYALSSEERKFTKKLEVKYVRLQSKNITKIKPNFVKNWKTGETEVLPVNYNDFFRLSVIFGILKEAELIVRLKSSLIYKDPSDVRYSINLLKSYLDTKNRKNSISSFKDFQILVFIIFTLENQIFSKTDNIQMFDSLIETTLRTEFIDGDFLVKMNEMVNNIRSLDNSIIHQNKASIRIYTNYALSCSELLKLLSKELSTIFNKYSKDLDLSFNEENLNKIMKFCENVDSLPVI